MVGAADTPGLESLGTVVYEPLWWFRRSEDQGVGADGLRGRKIAIGPQGSGTRALSLELFKRFGMEPQIGELLALGPNEAAEKLKAREIDVAFMMTSWDAPVVQQLLADERVALSGFPHADAVVALYPFLNKVIVPRGVTDLTLDQQPADVTLMATKTMLVVREDLHPAIQYLLLNAAREIHSGPSIFNHANAFPAAEAIDMPLSSEAARIGPAEVRERYGVEPKQVPDFIALRGDPSDKLPGAPGVGAAGAAGLLRKYGTLEAMLRAGRFPKLEKELRLYKSIATMDRKAPLPKLGDQTPTWDKAAALAREWGLNALAKRLEEMAEGTDG